MYKIEIAPNEEFWGQFSMQKKNRSKSKSEWSRSERGSFIQIEDQAISA